jgi:hypothetical protein
MPMINQYINKTEDKLKELLPYIFYGLGSLCFLIGTILVIIEKVKK